MRKRLFGLLATTAIVFAACQGAASPSASESAAATAAPTEAPSPTVAPEAPVDLTGTQYAPGPGKDGGQIIIGDWQEANQFQWFYSGQVSEANVGSATGLGLVTQTYDYKYAPALAAEIPTIDNGGVKLPGDNGDAATITWNLKPGLKWSDGEPITCADVQFTEAWVMDPAQSGLYNGTPGFEDISSIDCPSDTQVVMHYKNIYEGYINNFITGATPILAKHYFEKFPIADQTTGAGMRPDDLPNVPVSGPFKFASVTPGAELRLERNPYYQNPNNDNKPAYLDSLIWKWYADADAMIAGYRAGEVDFATDLADSDLPKVQDLGDQVHAAPALLYEALHPNLSPTECSKNPAVLDRGDGCPMADVAMRQALAYAIDKNEINTRLLGGNVEIANTFASPQVWFYKDEPPTTYDPEKAKSILDAAGWTVGADGVREKDGLKAKIELCTTTRQVRQDTLALIAAWLKDIGVEAVVNPVSPNDLFAGYNEATADTLCAASRGNTDVAEYASSSSIDPLTFYAYHSSQIPPAGGNWSRINIPEVDTAWDTVKNNLDFSIVKKAVGDFSDMYVEQAIEVPLYYRKNVDLANAVLGNFFQNPTQQGPTWNAQDWYSTK